MTTEQMQYLQTVFQEGTLSQAATKLGISQSTISKSLQALEKELDVALFVRIHGQLFPTRQGYILLDTAQKICGLQEQMTERIQLLRSSFPHYLSVGIPRYWDFNQLSLILAEFYRLAPSCTVIPEEYTASSLLGLLKAGALHMALVPGVKDVENGLRAFPLRSLSLLLAMPAQPGYKKTAGTFPTVKIHSCLHLPFVMPDEPSVLCSPINSFFKEQQFAPEILFKSSSPKCRLAAVRAGLGCTLIPDILCQEAEGLSLYALSPPVSVPLALVISDQTPIPGELKLLTDIFLKLEPERYHYES